MYEIGDQTNIGSCESTCRVYSIPKLPYLLQYALYYWLNLPAVHIKGGDIFNITNKTAGLYYMCLGSAPFI